MVGPVLQFAALPDFLQQLLNTEYALVILLFVFVLEGAMLLYFMPNQAIVPISIGLLGHTLSDIVIIIAIGVVGATIGQFALFLLAKRGGREWLLRRRWFRVSEDRLDRFDGWFERWGPIGVFVSNCNFLLITRGLLTVPAGLAEMDGRKFVVLSALGTLVYETLLAVLSLGVIKWVL